MKHGFERRWTLLWLMAVVAGFSSIGAVLSQSGQSAYSREPPGMRGAASYNEASQSVELVMFEEPGCPWCRRWHAEVGPGYPHSAEGKLAPLRILQIHEAASLGAHLIRPVRATPTFVLVSSGHEVGRITGYPGAEFFWPMLGDMIEKHTPAPKPDRRARLDAEISPERAP